MHTRKRKFLIRRSLSRLVEKRTFIWMLSFAAIIANLADALTTFIALTYFGLAELNPLMAFLYGYPLIGYPLKLGITWVLLPLPYCPLYKTLHHKNRWVQLMPILVLIFAIVLFTLLAIRNVSFILNTL